MEYFCIYNLFDYLLFLYRKKMLGFFFSIMIVQNYKYIDKYFKFIGPFLSLSAPNFLDHPLFGWK
jgi:hypothetical protein